MEEKKGPDSDGWLYNFTMGKTEFVTDVPQTDEQAEQYIPQYVIDLYRAYRGVDVSIRDALEIILKVIAMVEQEHSH